MLVLSRHANEGIVISDHVILTIIGVHGKQVRVGITAPENVVIYRQEIYDAINRQQRPPPAI